MRKFIVVIIPFLVCLLFIGCVPPVDEEEIQYRSKEELFNYIETHDVGVTVEDFEGIDMEDFIRQRRFRADREISPEFDFKSAIDWYWYKISEAEVERYYAYELKSVNSTNEEFAEFQKRFVRAIEGKGFVIYPSKTQGDGKEYIIEVKDSENMIIELAQTKDLGFDDTNKIKIIKRNSHENEPLNLDFGYFEFAMRNYSPYFYYCKSDKYFMFFWEGMSLLERFDVIKVFCEVG